MGLAPPDIYIPDDTPPQNLIAANYLHDIIEQISGQTLAVIQQPVSDPVPERSIKVGYPYSSSAYEESMINITADGSVELAGVDEYDPDNPDWPGELVADTVSDYMVRAGTYHAVMRFIHEDLGVIFGWPGDLGTAIPSTSRQTVPIGRRVMRPSCRYRNFLNFSRPGVQSFGLSNVDQSRSISWLSQHCCFFTDQANSGHPFRDTFDAIHSDGDPGGDGSQDYLFALQPDNTRSGHPGSRLAKMEVGEPDLIDYWETNILDTTLAANPLARSASCAFNDGHSTGHSVDPRALAMDYTGSDEQTWPLSWKAGDVNPRPQYALSDREVRFANLCRERMNQNYASYELVMLAYGPTGPAPEAARLLPGITVVQVANDLNDPGYTDAAGNQYRSNFDAWLKLGGQHVWRPNLGQGQGQQRGICCHDYKEFGERFKAIIPQGVVGFQPDALWEHWGIQGPGYYLFAEILWDHRRSIGEIMDRYYTGLFGPAADDIKAYYEAQIAVLEQNRVHRADFQQLQQMWTSSVFATLQGHLDDAAAAVTSGSDEADRVAFVQAAHDWAEAAMQSVEYARQMTVGVEATESSNLLTGANAVEDDTNGTTGWSMRFGHSGNSLPTVVSDETDGSDFAFRMTFADGSGQWNVERTLPGTQSDICLFSIRAKHSGVGERFTIRRQDDQGTNMDAAHINPEHTNWRTYEFEVRGGDTIYIFTDSGGAGGTVWLDNAALQAAQAIDETSLTNTWQTLVDDAIAAAITDAGWSGYPPVSSAGTSRIPTPNDFGNDPIDPDLE